VATGIVAGFGAHGYELALEAIARMVENAAAGKK
jgi:3-dehydroquinate dehydratase